MKKRYYDLFPCLVTKNQVLKMKKDEDEDWKRNDDNVDYYLSINGQAYALHTGYSVVKYWDYREGKWRKTIPSYFMYAHLNPEWQNFTIMVLIITSLIFIGISHGV